MHTDYPVVIAEDVSMQRRIKQRLRGRPTVVRAPEARTAEEQGGTQPQGAHHPLQAQLLGELATPWPIALEDWMPCH